MPWHVRQDNFINEAGEAGEHGDGSFASVGSKRTTMKMLYTVERMKVSICFRTFTLTVPVLPSGWKYLS